MSQSVVNSVVSEERVYEPLALGPISIRNRLIVGTGKYENYEVMQRALEASAAEVVTVAIRRERLIDAEGRSLLDHLELDRYTILPNTAGCFTADDAVRVARLGREILDSLDHPGRDWVKLEVLGDKKTLLPDPIGTLDACTELVRDGFTVMCYTSDDPIMAVRLREAGAACVMPAGSPIGSGRGLANPGAIQMILEMLKGEGDQPPAIGHQHETPAHPPGRQPSCFPVIIDAGVGTPSDVTLAMELGADGVLLNTGIAHARDPVRMALAMQAACAAGYHGFRAGRIPRRLYASASSPWEGAISTIPGE